MASSYVELHAHSFYSFGEGASHVHELVLRAKELEYPALALTDTNMCGALEFAREAKQAGIRPITGGEITLTDGSHLTLLAKNRTGYANICKLFTEANKIDRQNPLLDPVYLPDHSEGIVLLTGCRKGLVPRLVSEDKYEEAESVLKDYIEWFGRDSVYVELQQNFIHGDTRRNYGLVKLARSVDANVVTTNGAHYHVRERYKLQNALVAIKHNLTLNEVVHDLKLSGELYLKSPEQMRRLFYWCPEAIDNTVRIAEVCAFDLTKDLGYKLPTPPVPEGYTTESHLRQLANEAAVRRYRGITPKIEKRLEEEFRLIEKHNLSGFILLYREISLIARRIMIEEGLIDSETPLEEHPPGRSRGSSVALVIGYLLGLSHVDPILYALPLDRFMPEDMTTLPDIDLDFPRAIRDKLIARIHKDWGEEHAVLVGAISKYKIRGIVSDLGKVLGIPQEHLKMFKKHMHSSSAYNIEAEMLESADFRDKVNAPGWKEMIELAPALIGAPKRLGQHVGGMVLSTAPIPEMVPIRDSAIDGRYIMDWDKDSVEDANLAKLDLLSLPVLDQIEESRQLVKDRTGVNVDISRIDPEDREVYDMIGRGEGMCIFDLQSPAQLKMGQRLLPKNYKDIAYQVALIRPGVGTQGSSVSQFVERYRHGADWDFDHPHEKRALERGFGIIVWQEQVTQLIMDVANMTGAEAEKIRRDFARPNNDHLIARDKAEFLERAMKNGVKEETALKIFSKINGNYMFPESHSYAFGITAYQAAWFKCHYPVEFYVSFMNSQPMGFYPLEASKEDARHNGVPFLNPDINLSYSHCTAKDDSVLLGFRFVKNVGKELTEVIIEERERNGPYIHAGDLVRRTGIKPNAVESLVLAGAFDNVTPNRRVALWEAGLYNRPTRGQMVLPISMDDSVPDLYDYDEYDRMLDAYSFIGMYPKGQLMEFIRPSLKPYVLPTKQVHNAKEGDQIVVAGWPVARQHPRGENGTTFITILDETGSVQLIVWPHIFARCKRVINKNVLIATGEISQWDGTTNVIVSDMRAMPVPAQMPQSHDYH